MKTINLQKYHLQTIIKTQRYIETKQDIRNVTLSEYQEKYKTLDEANRLILQIKEE